MSSEQQVAAINPDFLWQTKWWAFGGRFPLLPIFRYRPANEWNTDIFQFEWLGFRVWSMDSPEIGFEISLNDYHLGAKVRLPYLIAGFWVPTFPIKWQHKLWRKPPGYKKRFMS